MTAEIQRLILAWYAQNARSLPWRGECDPYRVWVSEIMLQQTQVDTVIPYYQRWMTRFPSLPDLATSSEQEVLKVWEGLGYYSRARSLLHAARTIMAEHGGKIPSDRKSLQRLPGIGPYTAGAVASIAFSLDEATLDGNIRRLLCRLFDISLPLRSREGEARLWEIARSLLPPGRAGEFNQAMMDLGATICTPRSPRCTQCPAAACCLAFVRGLQDQRPVVPPRPAVPSITVCAAVIFRDGKVLIARRQSRGLLGGLWEFPGGKQEPGEDLSAALRREISEELDAVIGVGELLGVYRHAYTHFHVTLHTFCCILVEKEPRPLEASEIRWVFPGELADFPMGKIDRQISRRLVIGSPCI